MESQSNVPESQLKDPEIISFLDEPLEFSREMEREMVEREKGAMTMEREKRLTIEREEEEDGISAKAESDATQLVKIREIENSIFELRVGLEEGSANLREYMSMYKSICLCIRKYYRIPGNGILNEATLEQMRKPRCGIKDISTKTRLAWNFHLARESVLRVTEVAFEMWAANSSLTFQRDSMNSDIVLSFRKDFHTRICPSLLDGPGNVLAHTFLPSSEVSEVHVDNAEKWHIELTANPNDTIHLLHTLMHEIGHALGLHHSPQENLIMYAFVPSQTFPVRLSEADILAIHNLYGLRNKSEVLRSAMTVAMTTITTRDMGDSADLCALRRIDAMLVLENKMYVAYRRHLWSVDLNGKSYGRSLLLTDYLRFLPDNFTRAHIEDPRVNSYCS
ncbi:hypothetical protein P5V15_006934 [Pogonomyrmex californicus]